MKKNNILGYLLALFFPILASAHVKWFVDTDEVLNTMHGKVDFYSITSTPVLVWVALIFIVVLIAKYLDKVVPTPKWLLNYGLNNVRVINRVSMGILGLFLITVSFIWKIVLIPTITIDNYLGIFFAFIQVVLGLMFVFDYKPRIASIGLGAFCFGLIFASGIEAFLENLILLSLAVYFYAIHSSNTYLNNNSLKIVRWGTGLSLIILAFTEKLLYPELSLSFLSQYNWNFMSPLFPIFTDKLFILSVGMAEIIFGVLFILGYMTRVTTVSIAIFFALSVTTMFFGSGNWEVEDLVVYSVAILLIFYGNRDKSPNH